MSAFVPAPGLALSASRTFVNGTTLPISRSAPTDRPINTEISALKLPKLPSLPSPPKLPSLPKLPKLPTLGKKAADAAPTRNVAPKGRPTLKVGGRDVQQPERRSPFERMDSDLNDSLPKFYNPKTSRYEFQANAKGQNATIFDVRVSREKNTTNRRVNEQGTFRNMDPYTEELVWARPGWSSDEAKVAVRIALRNVLGNSNLFESELAELATSISCVTETANMKEFVRAIGLSSAYRKRFFEGSSNTRFIESNFMHFLGRAPHNQAEISEHIRIINEEGYNNEINSYVDSDEYDTLYGETRIPAVNFRGGHPYNNDMNRIAILNGACASTDRVYKKAILPTGNATGFGPYGVQKGLPEAWRGEKKAREQAGPVSNFSQDKFWNPQPPGLRDAERSWIARYGNWTKFWYKDSIVFKEVMKPKLYNSDEEVEEAQAVLKYGATVAKNYIGCRWAWDVAPVIEVCPPTSKVSGDGRLGVKMQKISFPIPADLEQGV